MSTELNRMYRYLDDLADREDLIADIRRVRRVVLQVMDYVPRDKWYEPRYHNWTPAAMLGHLHLMDNFLLYWTQLALVGIHPRISPGMRDRFNDTMARVFKNRLVETTIKGIQGNEGRICDFILHLPMERFTRQVFSPVWQTYLTVEQGLQEFFLYHWQDHLNTMREVEDLRYESNE
jgi:hypothetical protein